jgi:D-alanyl-D-alanine dipeptidase
MRFMLLFSVFTMFISCNEHKKESVANSLENSPKHRQEKTEEDAEVNDDVNVNDSLLKAYNLVDVQLLDPNIFVDMKYSGIDNFMRTKVYERIAKAYLQKDVAERLARCQDYLTSIDSSLHLLVYDAARPVSAQWKMWRTLDSIPSVERGKYVSNPINRSVHNYGAAVDLTICKSDGTPLDMGAEFDEFNEIAYPSKELQFLAKGLLSQKQIENRLLLRKVMRKEGFRNLPTEWWHFNACSRIDAAKKYKVIEQEP